MLGFLRMTEEERQKTMADNPPKVDCAHSAGGYFDWGWHGCGFGQLSFSYDRETEKWSCDTEMMGPESTRKLLHAFADYVADQLTLVIEKERAEWEARKSLNT